MLNCLEENIETPLVVTLDSHFLSSMTSKNKINLRVQVFRGSFTYCVNYLIDFAFLLILEIMYGLKVWPAL